jgi:hypothetical protein
VNGSITADRLTAIELDAADRADLAARAAHAAATTWFGTTIEIRFDDAAAADLHRRRYARLPAQGMADLRAHAAVLGEGTYFCIEDGPAFRWNDPLGPSATQFLADVVVRTEYFMERSPYQSFHAAAVRVNECAAAITAASMGGKTTTAIACARRGMPLYSDERCILDGELVLPFPRAINIRAASLDLLGLATHRGEDWTFVDYVELFGDASLPEPRPLRAIFFITGRGPKATVEAMPLESAVTALVRAPLRGRARGADRVVEATRLLRRARPYTLTLGTPDETARLIAQTVAS